MEMNLRDNANPDCPACAGRGSIKVGELSGQWAICPCAIAGQRLAVANLRLEKALPSRARRMTLASFEPGTSQKNGKALKAARNFVEHYERASTEGWVLGFTGEPAAGKTHLAVGILQACMKRYGGTTGAYINVPQMLRDERERWRESDGSVSPIEQAISVDLLVLDDLGAQYERDAEADKVTWVMEQLYTVLDARLMADRPTLYTTNMAWSDLKRRMDNEAGKRVLSRIERAQVCPPLEVSAVEGVNRQTEEAARLLLG